VATDQELVNRVRSGDVEAFASLARRYERSVLAIIQAEVRDPLMAQDVTAVTLSRAYRGLAKLPVDSPFGPWLLKIARRQTVNVLRSMPIPVGPGNRLSDSDRFHSYDDEWIENEHLLGLLARLPAEERRLIGLRFFDNHSLSEIANVVDRPVEQVTRQIANAVARLKYWWEWEQES